ncbi:MAG: KdsC family phosphatase [Halothiobacillaceae bacterium]
MSESENLLERLRRVRVLVLDVDGVMTDGKLYFDADGRELKAFHSRDGHGIKLAQSAGIEVAIISGRESGAVMARAANLGIEHCILGSLTKGEAIESLSKRLGEPLERFAAMGDDIIDLPMLTRAGVAATVQDAPECVKAHADWISDRRGGDGAVRTFIEALLQAQGSWDAVIARYLR